MELIESQEEKNQGPLAEPEPRYQTGTLPVEKTEHGQTWVRLAAAIVLGVILIVLIVLLARWIYHKAHNHAEPNPPTSQNTPAVSSNNPPASPAPGSQPGSPSGSSSSSSSASNSSGSSSSSSSNAGKSTPSQITNTGPGDVAAIFVGASLVAGGLHYLISVRRFAKNS